MAAGPINVTQPGGTFAVVNGDATWGLTNCTVTGGSYSITCPGPANYGMPHTGTPVVVADDAGSTNGGTTGERIPYVGTITNASSSSMTNILTLTLSSTGPAPVFGNTGVTHVAQLDVTNPGTGYHFGSTQVLACGTLCNTTDGHVSALGTPSVMTAETLIGVSGGTTPTSGTCTLTLLNQIGIGGNITQIAGTITGSVFSGGTIMQGGNIISDPNVYTSGTYSALGLGCGYASPPTVTYKYGILAEQIISGDGTVTSQTGIYASTPPCDISGGVTTTTSIGDFGTGLKLGCFRTGETFPGTVSFGTDNTTALQALIGNATAPAAGTMNYAAAHGNPVCLYFPSASPSAGYMTQPLNSYSGTPAAGNFAATGYGCFLGDGHFYSNLYIIPNVEGDAIAWVNSNQNASITDLTNTQTFSNFRPSNTGTANQAGAALRNITITGNRLSTAFQNGAALYGQTTYGLFDNIVISFMQGHGFWAGGPTGGSGSGDFNESIINNARFELDGYGATMPALEITANGTSEGSNSLNLTNIRMYQSFGPGMVIHNSGTALVDSSRDIRISNLMIEGSGVSKTNLGGPLLQFGDKAPPTAGVNVTNVTANNVELINPVLGFPALLITGGSTTDTGYIDIQGIIQGQTAATLSRVMRAKQAVSRTADFTPWEIGMAA